MSDALGSVVGVATDELGVEDTTFAYDVFGQRATKRAGVFTPWGFTGRRHERDQNDTIYYRSRYYDSNTGRFLSEDPLNPRGTITASRPAMLGPANIQNRYGYANGAPTFYVDPLGQRSIAQDRVAVQFAYLAMISATTAYLFAVAAGTLREPQVPSPGRVLAAAIAVLTSCIFKLFQPWCYLDSQSTNYDRHPDLPGQVIANLLRQWTSGLSRVTRRKTLAASRC